MSRPPRPGIRTYHELEGGDSSLSDQIAAQQRRVEAGLAGVRRIVAVTSGKGGVGKSLVAAVLASRLARDGLRVGLLDADFNGPSAPRLLGAAHSAPLRISEAGVHPASAAGGVGVISMGLLLETDAPLRWREPGEASFVWRGAQERAALREFLADVRWEERDLLVVDLPPGTQRIVELHELVPRLDGALAVTIPSRASGDAVVRAMQLCADRGIRLLGVVENLAGHRCAECGATTTLHPGDAGETLARRFGVPLLARMPFDAELARLAERGRLDALDPDGPAGREWGELARRVREAADARGKEGTA